MRNALRGATKTVEFLPKPNAGTASHTPRMKSSSAGESSNSSKGTPRAVVVLRTCYISIPSTQD